MDFNRTFTFLTKLKKNNNKAWFDKNKEEYVELKNEFESFVNDLISKLEKFDSSLSNVEAKNCTFRIYKDVRFSKDKTPYKTHFGAYIAKGGRKSPFAGYYIHLEPGHSMMAGGIWMPQPAELAKIRQEIDYNGKEFKKILNAKSFQNSFGELQGEKLVRPPKDYEADNEMIEYLKHKSFIGTHNISDKTAKDSGFINYVSTTAKAILPLNNFLNRALESEE